MYDEIKKKKNHRYLVFYIKDEKTIAVEKIGMNIVFWKIPILRNCNLHIQVDVIRPTMNF